MRALLILLLAGWLGLAGAQEVDPDRMRKLSEELRCLVCQNQSIADSQAPLAEDLRAELERLMREGYSDAEIREWMVARYGDFVLYRPPFNPRTYALWLGPLLLLLLGGALIVRLLRQPPATPPAPNFRRQPAHLNTMFKCRRRRQPSTMATAKTPQPKLLSQNSSAKK